MQTVPEKLGLSELAERSARVGGEFAERPCPGIPLPRRKARAQKPREVGEVDQRRVGRTSNRFPFHSFLVAWTQEERPCLRLGADGGRAAHGPARAGSLQTVPAEARSPGSPAAPAVAATAAAPGSSLPR